MTSFNAQAASTDATPASVTPIPATAGSTEYVLEYGGKKFTQAELLTKLTHADTHITTLVGEARSKDELLVKANEALAKAANAAAVLQQPVQAAQQTAAPVVSAAPDISSVVEQALSARETQRAQEANLKAAQDAMTKAFGEKADEKAKAVATSVGMSFDELVHLAKTKPLAFNRLFPEFAPASVKSGPTPKAAVSSTAQESGASVIKTESGYWASESIKDRTKVYLDKLNQLSK